MKKTFFYGFFVVLICSRAISQNISENDAKQIALDYFDKNVYPATTVKDVSVYPYELDSTLFIVNMKDGGWVAVSSDKRMKPILALSLSGHFDNNLPPALKLLLDEYVEQIKYNSNAELFTSFVGTEDNNDELLNYSNNRGYTIGTNLLSQQKRGSVKWKQSGNSDFPPDCSKTYNRYITMAACDLCERGYVGCGPVAMGQVMRYWQWPKKSPYPYREGYNWNIMPPELKNSSLNEEVNAVSFLLKDCGTASGAIYTCDGTAILGSGLLNGFKLFGYKSVTNNSRREWNYGYSWIELIRSEIDCSRPVILFGMRNIISDWHFLL